MRPIARLMIEAEGERTPGEKRGSSLAPALVFDSSKGSRFTATVDKAKGDDGVESVLTMQAPNVPREMAKRIPEGAYVQLTAGYDAVGSGGPKVGMASLFYGQVTLAYDESGGGSRTLKVLADAAPQAFRSVSAYVSFPRSPNKSYTLGQVLDALGERTGMTFNATQPFRSIVVRSFSAYSDIEETLIRLVSLGNAAHWGGRVNRFSISVSDDSPAVYNIVDAKDLSGQVATVKVERMSKYTHHAAPVFVRAGAQADISKDTFFPAKKRLADGSLVTLSEVTFEDHEDQLTHIEYSVQTRFDPRLALDRVIEILDEGQTIGYIAGAHSNSHSVGIGTWGSSVQGPLGTFPDPVGGV